MLCVNYDRYIVPVGCLFVTALSSGRCLYVKFYVSSWATRVNRYSPDL